MYCPVEKEFASPIDADRAVETLEELHDTKLVVFEIEYLYHYLLT